VASNPIEFKNFFRTWMQPARKQKRLMPKNLMYY
jgi:hypothetical protein